MGRFFIDDDFDIFDIKYAALEDTQTISRRKRVFDKFKTLHECSLKSYCSQLDLNPHWKKEHLTSVYFPFAEANGGYVDYMRLGYGKSKDAIYNMYRKAGLVGETMSFYKVTQLQIGIDYNGWWINLYLDKSDVIEHANLRIKLMDKANYNRISKLINSLKNDFELGFFIGSMHSNIKYESYNSGKTYLDRYIDLCKNKEMFSLSIGIFLDRYDKYNDIILIEGFIKEKFYKLYPLYKEISWALSNDYL
ncbi:hypothetical protein Q3V94_11910 [Caloramator sp. CAR-1]|uniref:hypothetical protein n=1 Tax=Caloramator sp. CAR-1 TaxID=3062777 RepID=UPI0026E3964F|nr:hypothetical protein [Caloramator sp. CAR-1]MDO6355760.1 hypothetical protein [Caloramator sp. CAR-1]